MSGVAIVVFSDLVELTPCSRGSATTAWRSFAEDPAPSAGPTTTLAERALRRWGRLIGARDLTAHSAYVRYSP
jgi:hypothetical protein